MVRLKVKHIDSAQNIIRVEQSKSRKDRNVMLSPDTLDLLRQWWKTRPPRSRPKTSFIAAPEVASAIWASSNSGAVNLI